MNSIWEKNKSIFTQWSPVLREKIMNASEGGFAFELAQSGEPALYVIPEGSNQKIMLDSFKDPRAEAKEQVDKIQRGQSSPLIVIMGFGSGYLFEEAVRKYPDARIVVIERDPHVFHQALRRCDLSSYLMNENFAFFIGVKPSVMQRLLYQMFYFQKFDRYLPCLELLKIDRLVSPAKSYYAECAEVILRSTETYWDIYIGNAYEDALKGLDHVLENIQHFNRCFALQDLKNIFHGKVGIVVSSGPSLDRRLEELKNIEKKSVIVCADSALKKLLQYGIKPFAVTCVERDDVNATLFQNYEIPRDIVLMAPPVVKPITLRDYPGPIALTFRLAYPFYALPPLIKSYDFGISCAHLAYFSLVLMGCKKIALFGQDLAFDRESGISHFTDALPAAHEQYRSQERLQSLGNDGRMLDTSRDWLQFKVIFEELYPAYTDGIQPHELINVIEETSGIALKGIPHADPHSFCKSLVSENIFSPSVNFSDLQKKLGDGLAGFHHESKKVFTDAAATFEKVAHFFSSEKVFINAKQFVDETDRLLLTDDIRSRYLVEDLIKPHYRKFIACALCLWTDEEFFRELPAFKKLLLKVCEDALLVLQNSRPKKDLYTLQEPV